MKYSGAPGGLKCTRLAAGYTCMDVPTIIITSAREASCAAAGNKGTSSPNQTICGLS